MKIVFRIWQKEMLDTLRDRRTLLVMVLVPLVLMPALFVGLTKLIAMQTDEAEKEILEILMIGGERAPKLSEFLSSCPQVELKPVADVAAAREAIKRKDAKVALVIEGEFEAEVGADRAARLTLLNNETHVASMIQTARLKSHLDEYRDQLVSQRVRQRGLDPALLAPFVVEPCNQASPEEMAGFVLGMIIPLILIMWAITGGMYSAIDLSAGEKERGTLEALLLSPASRTQITLGKFAAVFSVSYVTMIAALFSLFLTFLFFPLSFGSGGGAAGPAGVDPATARAATLTFQIAPQALALMLAISVLLAATFSALQLALGIFAKSFKEAQNLITPLYLVVVIPVVVVNSLPNFKPATGHFLIPGLNAVLLFKELLMNTHTGTHVVATFASMSLCAAVCMVVTVGIFNRESVVLKM